MQNAMLASTTRLSQHIYDLEDYLKARPGIHAMLTGTFDPPHIQHTAPIVLGTEQLKERGIHIESFIVLPHNRNTDKKPIAPLDLRRKWFMDTMTYENAKIAEQVWICIDRATSQERDIYDLSEQARKQIIRIAGGDKRHKPRDGVETIIIERDIPMSSTEVRAMMRQTRSHPTLKNYLAPSVLLEINELGLY